MVSIIMTAVRGIKNKRGGRDLLSSLNSVAGPRGSRVGGCVATGGLSLIIAFPPMAIVLTPELRSSSSNYTGGSGGPEELC